VVLIDGETLAQLMIELNFGVPTVNKYEVKKWTMTISQKDRHDGGDNL
jgi:restriction endonuclease Mrr